MFRKIDTATAYDIANQMENKHKNMETCNTIYSGDHPEHGSIHVVIAPFGDAIVLPRPKV